MQQTFIACPFHYRTSLHIYLPVFGLDAKMLECQLKSDRIFLEVRTEGESCHHDTRDNHTIQVAFFFSLPKIKRLPLMETVFA